MENEPVHLNRQMFRSRALWNVLAAVGIVYVLWNVPSLNFVLYPLQLFVTFIHEAGHGLMAILTQGQVGEVIVNPDTSGLTTTLGGSRALILPAGYLGAAFFGALLFYLVNTLPYSRAFSVILGIGLIFLSVVFTTLLSTAFIVGVLSGAGLMLLGWKSGSGWNVLVLDVLAITCGLNAVLDLLYLVRYSGAASGSVLNDAAAFSRDVAPFLPGSVWALIWAIIAVLMLGAAVWYSLIRPRRLIKR